MEATSSIVKPDLICITEAWTNDNISDNVLNITNYELISDLRRDRNDTKDGRGGGLLVYVKQGLNILPIDKDNDFNQYVSFDVLNSENIVCKHVILAYRPPNSPSTNNEKICDIVKNAPKNTLLIGDINFPKIDWDNLTCDNRGKDFMNVCIDHNFTQYIDFPTCNRPPFNTLDLVLSNDNSIISVDNLGPLGNSDHVMILLKTDFDRSDDVNNVTKLNWKKADYNAMKTELESVNWKDILNSNDIEDNWQKFVTTINTVIDKNVPVKHLKNGKDPYWMNRYIVRLCRKKKRLYKRMRQTGNHMDYNKYKEIEKEVRKVIRRAKRKFEIKVSKEAGNEGKRKFNNYVKSKLGKNSGIGPLLDKNKKLVGDEQEMANILNDYFSSVFTKDNNDDPEPAVMNFDNEVCNFVVTNKDIAREIDVLKAGKAPGPDNISTTFLKNMKVCLLEPLNMIFNSSLSKCQVPKDWKNAKVVPIHKKGSRGDPGNYRPVSLTSSVCKVMERILRAKIMDHLIVNKLINQSQHGFMPNRSCQTNLLEFLDRITSILDNGNAVDIIYLDYAKAFDKISHKKLIKKLHAHGIRGNVLKWIKDWLTNREQWVELNGKKSSCNKVTSGVPQGSVLGPILFVIFINDIDMEAINLDLIKKFADDTKGAKQISGPEDAQHLQECINSLQNWGQKWSMEFNVKKCKIMHCGKTNPKFDYNIDGTILEKVEAERDVGVTVTSNLKPTKQCQEAAGRARRELGKISRCFHFRDRKVFIRLYKQFVRSHLEFSSCVWTPWNQGDIDILENVQKQAVRMVSGLSSNNYEDKLRELDLWPLVKRRKMYDLVQVYKIINNIGDVDISLTKVCDNNSEKTSSFKNYNAFSLIRILM